MPSQMASDPLAHGNLSLHACGRFSSNSHCLSQFRTHTLSRKEATHKGVFTMSTEDNKAIARRFFATNEKQARGEDISADAKELLAPNARHHQPGAPELDNAAFLQFVQAFSSGFPGYRFDIEDQIAEGDKVSTRITFPGTHTGNFQGIPPTG